MHLDIAFEYVYILYTCSRKSTRVVKNLLIITEILRIRRSFNKTYDMMEHEFIQPTAILMCNIQKSLVVLAVLDLLSFPI